MCDFCWQNIVAGTAVRFEPGETKRVSLVEIGGNRVVRGGNGLCDGKVSSENIKAVMDRVMKRGFEHEDDV